MLPYFLSVNGGLTGSRQALRLVLVVFHESNDESRGLDEATAFSVRHSASPISYSLWAVAYNNV